MTGSASRPAKSSTNHKNVEMRKQFWDTVLNTPEDQHDRTTSALTSIGLTTSALSKCTEVGREGNPMAIPKYVIPPHRSSSAKAAHRTTKKLAKGDSGPAQRDVERWQKGRKARPYKCLVCQSCYAQKGDMVRHMRCVHEGLRPFQCDVCGNSFGRRSILNKHMKRHWKKTDVGESKMRT